VYNFPFFLQMAYHTILFLFFYHVNIPYFSNKDFLRQVFKIRLPYFFHYFQSTKILYNRMNIYV